MRRPLVRRMVRGKTVTFLPLVTLEWVAGYSMSFLREDVVDELVIDMLVMMHVGGVKVTR